jgi:hypothetical protein
MESLIIRPMREGRDPSTAFVSRGARQISLRMTLEEQILLDEKMSSTRLGLGLGLLVGLGFGSRCSACGGLL